MPRTQDESPTLELWFERDDDATGNGKCPVALTKTRFKCIHQGKKIEARTNRYQDKVAVPWTAGVMAHMWYLVKCAAVAQGFKQNCTVRIEWEPATKGSPIGSIHALARKASDWREWMFGDVGRLSESSDEVGINQLFAARQINFKPHRRLNEQLLPAHAIAVFRDETPVANAQDLEELATNILEQFQNPKRRREQPLRMEIEFDVQIWSQRDEKRSGISVFDSGSLPLRVGDAIRVSIRLNQPAYVYLIWISNGVPRPLYPWSSAKWTQPGEDMPVETIDAPPYTSAADFRGWPIGEPTGVETLLALTREKPILDECDLQALLRRFPQSHLTEKTALVEFQLRKQHNFKELHVLDAARPQLIPFQDARLLIHDFLRHQLADHFTAMAGFSCLSSDLAR